MRRINRKLDFPESIAAYMKKSNRWRKWSKRDVAINTALVFVTDIGAAQHLLNELKVPVDLYERD